MVFFSGYQLFQIYGEYKKGTDEYDQIRHEVFQVRTDVQESSPIQSQDEVNQKQVIEKKGPILVNGIELSTLLGTRYQCDFDQLLSINSEVVESFGGRYQY